MRSFVRKFKKGIRDSFFVHKFEKEKGNNGIYTDRDDVCVNIKVLCAAIINMLCIYRV